MDWMKTWKQNSDSLRISVEIPSFSVIILMQKMPSIFVRGRQMITHDKNLCVPFPSIIKLELYAWEYIFWEKKKKKKKVSYKIMSSLTQKNPGLYLLNIKIKEIQGFFLTFSNYSVMCFKFSIINFSLKCTSRVFLVHLRNQYVRLSCAFKHLAYEDAITLCILHRWAIWRQYLTPVHWVNTKLTAQSNST